MISSFNPRPHKLQNTKINIKKFFMRVKNQEQRIARLLDVRTNRQIIAVTYFSLPKDPQRLQSWLIAISRGKSNLPSNVFIYFDHFEEKYFDQSCDLQNRIFCTDRPIKRRLISTAITTLLPHNQTLTPKKTSEIRANQKEKEEVKL